MKLFYFNNDFVTCKIVAEVKHLPKFKKIHYIKSCKIILTYYGSTHIDSQGIQLGLSDHVPLLHVTRFVTSGTRPSLQRNSITVPCLYQKPIFKSIISASGILGISHSPVVKCNFKHSTTVFNNYYWLPPRLLPLQL